MKKIGLGVVFTTAVAFCLGLVGCGGTAEDYTPYFAGNWELSSVESAESGMTADEITMMKELGMALTLDLAEDGTGSMDVFGEMYNITWEAQSAEEAIISIDGDPVAATLSGADLVLDQADSKLVFSKAGSTSTAAAEGISDTAADAGADDAEAQEDDAEVAEDGAEDVAEAEETSAEETDEAA